MKLKKGKCLQTQLCIFAPKIVKKQMKDKKTERFEIILNAPPLSKRKPNKEDFEICKSVTLERFKNFGLNFQVDLEEKILRHQEISTIFFQQRKAPSTGRARME